MEGPRRSLGPIGGTGGRGWNDHDFLIRHGYDPSESRAVQFDVWQRHGGVAGIRTTYRQDGLSTSSRPAITAPLRGSSTLRRQPPSSDCADGHVPPQDYSLRLGMHDSIVAVALSHRGGFGDDDADGGAGIDWLLLVYEDGRSELEHERFRVFFCGGAAELPFPHTTSPLDILRTLHAQWTRPTFSPPAAAGGRPTRIMILPLGVSAGVFFGTSTRSRLVSLGVTSNTCPPRWSPETHYLHPWTVREAVRAISQLSISGALPCDGRRREAHSLKDLPVQIFVRIVEQVASRCPETRAMSAAESCRAALRWPALRGDIGDVRRDEPQRTCWRIDPHRAYEFLHSLLPQR